MNNSKVTRAINDSIEYFKKNEMKRFLIAFASVFAIGLFAHAYCFTNLTLSHDGLNEFYVYGPVNYLDLNVFELKISTGRQLIPIYDLIFRGRVVVPWLSGLLSLVWLSFSVWFASMIFNFKSVFKISLVSGFFVS